MQSTYALSILTSGIINDHTFDTGLISNHKLQSLADIITDSEGTTINDKVLTLPSANLVELGDCMWLFRGCKVISFWNNNNNPPAPNYTLAALLKFMGAPNDMLIDTETKKPLIVGHAFILPPKANGTLIKTTYYSFPKAIKIEIEIFWSYWSVARSNSESKEAKNLALVATTARCFRCRMRVIYDTVSCETCKQFTYCSRECANSDQFFGHDYSFCKCCSYIAQNNVETLDDSSLYLFAHKLRRELLAKQHGFQKASTLLTAGLNLTNNNSSGSSSNASTE